MYGITRGKLSSAYILLDRGQDRWLASVKSRNCPVFGKIPTEKVISSCLQWKEGSENFEDKVRRGPFLIERIAKRNVLNRPESN